MILSLRPSHPVQIPGPVPLRRRVIVLGATEAGISAAFHLGKSALLLEQRDFSSATDRGSSGVERWQLPQLQSTHAGTTWDDVWQQLMALMSGEVKLGCRVTAIDSREHHLQTSTGESFVYDKLVCTLRLEDLQRLAVDDLPRSVHSIDWWRHWARGRDIELLDVSAQLVCSDLDGEAAGRRVAEAIRRAMAVKYSAAMTRTAALFQPGVVRACSSVDGHLHAL